MERIVTPEEMRHADRITTDIFGVDSLILMERAAMAAYECLKREAFCLNEVLVVCGTGNNGGDGAALARILLEHGIESDVVLVGKRERCTFQCEKQLEILEKYGKHILAEIPEQKRYTTIIDAIFGISLNRDLDGVYRKAVEEMNDLRRMLLPAPKILSLDMPSGIHGGTGKVMGAAVTADVTISFAYKKLGQILYPGASSCGRLYCANIGITDRSFLGNLPLIRMYEDREICFPERRADGNKGTFGKVLLIAGSMNMCGAAILSGKAAFRSGCGMVKIMTVEENRVILQESFPEAMLLTYTEDGFDSGELSRSMDWCDCIGIGPGLSQGETALRLVEFILANAAVPVVADADALNIIAKRPEILSSCQTEVVVTPHIGEFGRLTGLETEEIKTHFYDVAADFARRFSVVCVLKDARTIIVNKHGEAFINCTGNSGMATAGSGDVLTGIICSLIAQGLEPFAASSLGCALHGRAGENGSAFRSPTELMAGDIIEGIVR